MRLAEYASYDAMGLAALVRAGEITATELAAIARLAVDRLNGTLNAIMDAVSAPPLPAPARGPDQPFIGVPFLIKNLGLPMRGISCNAGSRLLQGAPPAEFDGELLERFRASGVTIIGRTNTPEFGYATTTEPVLYGPTRNPWDVRLSAGGSSGGSAAAVAAGLVPIAHGTDAGGSIRIPAAACGIVGLKPTRGRNPTGPGVANPMHGLAASHVLSRTVRDTAVALDAIVGSSPGDPFTLPRPAQPFWPINHSGRRLRIGFMTTPEEGFARIDPDCAHAVEQTAAVCAELGHSVEESRPRYSTEAFHHANRTFWCAYVASAIDSAERMTHRSASPENLEATIWRTCQEGRSLTALDLERAEALANQVRHAVATFFSRYDILLTPAMAMPPWPLGALNANDPKHDAESWYRATLERTPFTALYNMTGQPALSLPLASTLRGLPIGVQVIGRFADEQSLLSLAAELEEALPWSQRVPSIHVSREAI